jgi:hypothetical protein
MEAVGAGGFVGMPPTLTTAAPRSTPVQEFCASQGISDAVRTAIEVAISVFPIGAPIGVLLGEDPEINDQFVVINVPALGTAESLYSAYRVYLQRTRSLPAYAKAKIRTMVEPI